MLQLAWDAQAPAWPIEAVSDTDHCDRPLEHGARNEIHDRGNLHNVISSSMDRLERRYLGASGPEARYILSRANDALAQAAEVARRMLAPAGQVRTHGVRTPVTTHADVLNPDLLQFVQA